MTLIDKIKQHLPGGKTPLEDTDSVTAYNMWAETYDAQPGNLMLDLDEDLFSLMLSKVFVKNKTVVDVGCGTGRHWKKLQDQEPLALYGYDVSPGMLEKLNDKFPGANTYLLENDYLPQLADASADMIISTLTIAHIENIQRAIYEWQRVLKNNGEIIITDYHPEALAKGGKRTFHYNGATVAIKNYIHSVDKVFDTFKQAGFEIAELQESLVNDSMKHYYEEKNALHVFEKFRNVPIIYGMRLIKRNASSKSQNHK